MIIKVNSPWPIKIAVGMMGLSALKDILIGALFLFIFGFGLRSQGLQSIFLIIPFILSFIVGVILVIIGILTIKYVRAVFRMQKKGYVGSFVLILLGLSTTGLGLIRSGKPFNMVVGLVFSFIYICSAIILYHYREKFVS